MVEFPAFPLSGVHVLPLWCTTISRTLHIFSTPSFNGSFSYRFVLPISLSYGAPDWYTAFSGSIENVISLLPVEYRAPGRSGEQAS